MKPQNRVFHSIHKSKFNNRYIYNLSMDSKIREQRWRAYNAVANAKRSGKLIPEPCNACGGKAEAHHNDYDKPLEVVWLCRKHHRLVDSTVIDKAGVHEYGSIKRSKQNKVGYVGRRRVHRPKTPGG